jgi:glucosamine 6-phosphate synthetase-like amidotransferase/phosphosugar isomerase protein
MAAIKLAKENGAFVGVCNVKALLYREKLMQVLIHAGPEIGVASLKAFKLLC